MECNVGGVEKNMRIATGAASIVLGLVAPLSRGGRIAAVSFGAVQLLTGLSGYCPVNQLMGRNSCRMSVPEAAEAALHSAQEFAA